MDSQVGLVILAAGSSSRMGKPKQLLDLGGKVLLQRVIDSVKKVPFCEKVLVLGAYADLILEKIDSEGFHILFNGEWEEGMASSLRKGLQKLIEMNSKADAVLYMLADQPMVNEKIISNILLTHKKEKHRIVASAYNDALGVPALFPFKYFDNLVHLKGNEGARKIIQHNLPQVAAVNFAAGIYDVDTEEDYKNIKKLLGL